MKRSEAYPSKYLSADDVVNGPKVVTIRSVSHEPMADGKVKPTVYLDGYQKPAAVNKTNADILYTLAGTDDDTDWPGITIGLFTERARRPDGTPCEAIRFRAPPQKSRKVVKATKPDGPEFDEDDPPPFMAEDLEQFPFN